MARGIVREEFSALLSDRPTQPAHMQSEPSSPREVLVNSLHGLWVQCCYSETYRLNCVVCERERETDKGGESCVCVCAMQMHYSIKS